MSEVYVDAVTVLVTREQLDWLNAQVDPRHERGIPIRALIDEQMANEAALARFSERAEDLANNCRPENA